MQHNRPRPSGLPSSPASRLPVASRARQDHPPTSYAREDTATSSSSSSRHTSQRSLSSRSAPREPIQPSSEFRRANSTRDNDREARYPGQSDGSSTSSDASTASSFLSRMRSNRAGYESSRTSLEEGYESPKRDRGHEAKSLRKRGMEQPGQSHNEEPHRAPAEGEGYSLWNQVVTVASGLSVNVSKAWATKLPTFNGEATPQGEESRLTRAMKAYHLEKARDPTDLPAWLFEEHERRPVARSRFTDGQRDGKTIDQPQPSPRSRGLREVYAASATKSASLRPERAPVSKRSDERAEPARGTNRLKELREARRYARAAPAPLW